MPRTSIPTDLLRARVDAFVEDLSELIREAALEAVREALGSPAAARSNGRARVATSGDAPPKATKSKPGKRVRRSNDDLAGLTTRVLDFVSVNPGERLEGIANALGEPSKELKRPVQMLLADKKLRTEGQRRGTSYFATGTGVEITPAARKAKARKRTRAPKRQIGEGVA